MPRRAPAEPRLLLCLQGNGGTGHTVFPGVDAAGQPQVQGFPFGRRFFHGYQKEPLGHIVRGILWCVRVDNDRQSVGLLQQIDRVSHRAGPGLLKQH